MYFPPNAGLVGLIAYIARNWKITDGAGIPMTPAVGLTR